MLYRRLLFVAMVMGNLCSAMEQEGKGEILIFSGTSTSGKTSAALELKKQLTVLAPSKEVEILAIDSYFIPKMKWAVGLKRANPFNYLIENSDLTKPEDVEGVIKASREELWNAAKVACAQGRMVIVDCPVYSVERIAAYKEAFAGYNVSWVLAYCNLPMLVQRVVEHNAGAVAKGQPDEQRSLAQVLDQFEQLYTCKTASHVGTLSQDVICSICDKAKIQHAEMQSKISDLLRGVQNAMHPTSIEKIKELMMAKWKPGVIDVAPVVEHDCVVDTGKHSAEECAWQIINKFYPELVS